MHSPDPNRIARRYGLGTLVLLLAFAASASSASARPAADVARPIAHAAAVCADYPNQAAAQAAADTRDSDGDGVYCESLPCPCAGPGSTAPPPPADSDGDGVPDSSDICPTTYAKTANGCPAPAPDADGDGVADGVDQCPTQAASTTNGCLAPVLPAPAPAEPVQDEIDKTIVLQRAMLGVELGVTLGDVSDALGTPDAVRFRKNPIAGGRDRLYVYGRTTFAAVDNGDKFVFSITTTDRSVRTASALGVGSTERQIKKGVRGLKCRTYRGLGRSCTKGGGSIGKPYSDFQIGKNGRVRRVTVGYVLD
jgi:hypothetical protein